MDTSYNMGSAQLGKIATIFVLIAGILLLIAGILGLVGGLSSYGPAHYGGGLIGSVITLVAGAVALVTFRSIGLEVAIVDLVLAILVFVFGAGELGLIGAVLLLIGAIIALVNSQV